MQAIAGIYRLSSGLSLNKCVELESDGAEDDGCLCQAAGLCFPVRERALFIIYHRYDGKAECCLTVTSVKWM